MRRCLTLFLAFLMLFSWPVGIHALEAEDEEDRPIPYYDIHPTADATIDQVLGTDREQVLAWLLSHESDDYYLGTPFYYDTEHPWSTVWCIRPNGRFHDNQPMMNCTGFVADVLMECGVTEEALQEAILERHPYDTYINASYWLEFMLSHTEIKLYVFDTIPEAL